MALDEQKQRENSELRKKRRKKEQMQALAVLLGAILVVILVVSGVVSGVNAILGSKQEKQKAENVKQETVEQEVAEQEPVEAETEEEQQSEETTEPAEEVDTDSISETEDVVEEELTEEEIEAKKAEILQSYVDNIMSTLTLEEKIGQMYLVTPYNITGVVDAKSAGSSMSAAMNQYAVGGILFDDGNIENKEQFSLMINNIGTFSKLNMFYAICDEGGEESPLSLSGIRENPLSSQSEIAALGVSEAYSVGISKSSEFRSLGINLNIAPMTDVAENTSSWVASKAYSSDVKEVMTLAKSEFKGMKDQGIDCCLKYFPSHGDVDGDTKTTRVTSQRTKEQLDANEGIIYKGLIEEGVPMIMVSHITMPKIVGDNTPASLSSEIVTDILRTELGFEGVVATDYMSKNAITRFYKHADASVMAVQAGVDMIVAPGDFDKSYNGILNAVQAGEITEERINESVERILKMKYKNIISYEETTVTEDAETVEEMTEEATEETTEEATEEATEETSEENSEEEE